MRTITIQRAVALAIVLAALGLSTRSVETQQGSALSREAACNTLQMASAGGPMPKSPTTLVVRWLGTANHEIAFQNQVLLLDGHYDRHPRTRPLGFTKDDIKRVDAFFVGHGSGPHHDHVSEVPEIAMRTGAPVYGHDRTIDVVKWMGLPVAQAKLVKGGELLEFRGFKVEPTRARHAIVKPMGDKVAALYENEPLSAEAKAKVERFDREQDEFSQAHPTPPNPPGYPMMGFLFTFGDFKFFWQDSAGALTDEEREMMQRIGKTDLAIISYQGQTLPKWQIAETLPFIKLLKPTIYMPTHHDELGENFIDMDTLPLFQAIRDEVPGSKGVSPMYRTPVCFDVKTKEMYVGP